MSEFVEIEPSLKEEQDVIERVLASRHFAKAQLLVDFLRFAWQHSAQKDFSHINEQEIGVRVFRRRPGYDPGEDNIVRNYARQLRKRLDAYYSHEGSRDPIRVDMPRGGYAVVFTNSTRSETEEPEAPTEPISALQAEINLPAAPPSAAVRPFRHAYAYLLAGLLVGAAALLLGLALWHHARMKSATGSVTASEDIFWSSLFSYDKDTYIVPADTGYVALQEISGKTYSLAEYEAWPAVELHDHKYLSYLRSQRNTSVLDLQLATQFEHIRNADPHRMLIRSPRDLKIDDLNSGNVVLFGSVYSNPWVEIFQSRLNFHFLYSPDENRAQIANLHPLVGEDAAYFSSWNSYSSTTYAVLAYLPNLNRTGHALLIQGMDGAGTEAAANVLFTADSLHQILDKVRKPDGTFRGFEVLLRATDIGSHATSPQILSIRFID
jgi:hypothetical protein